MKLYLHLSANDHLVADDDPIRQFVLREKKFGLMECTSEGLRDWRCVGGVPFSGMPCGICLATEDKLGTSRSGS